MACCSEFQTECLRVVTIKYLKNFVGNNLQDNSGQTMSITHPLGDDYCPTYSELTGGTLVQNWLQGVTPNRDEDGIIVSGIYENNQLVRQEDLSFKYTRLKTFTIDHSGSIVDACGGNIDISYVHVYNRIEKSMNASCETITSSGDVEDTQDNEVSLSAGCDWVHPQVGISIVDAQPQIAPSRTCDVTGEITFRTTNHTSITTIEQEALTGNCGPCDCSDMWVIPTLISWNSDGEVSPGETEVWINIMRKKCIDDVSISISTPTNFNASLVGKDFVRVSPKRKNTGATVITETLTIYYKAVGELETKNCSIEVPLIQRGVDCDCGDFSISPTTATWEFDDTSISSITIDSGVCISDITLGGITHFSASIINGEVRVSPIETNTGATAITETLTISYKANGTNCTSKTVLLTHNPEACDCSNFSISPTAATWEFDELGVSSLTIDSGVCISDITLNGITHFSASVVSGQVKVVPKTTNTGATAITETLNIGYKANGNSCTAKTVQLTHKPEACDCSDFSVSPTAATWEFDKIGVSSLTIDSGVCISNITLGSLTHFSASVVSGQVKVVPKTTNTGATAITESLSIGYKASGSACTPTVVELKHKPEACDCSNFSVSPTALTWAYSSTSASNVSIDESGVCISDVVLNSLTHFSASVVGDNIVIEPKTINSGETDIVETLRVDYKASGSACTPSMIELTHNPKDCDCGDLTITIIEQQ